MRYNQKVIPLLLAIFFLFYSCNKDPYFEEVKEDTEIEKLLEKKSYFKPKATTLVISPDQYESLIVERDSTYFIFQQSDVFNNISEIEYITYPFFSEKPENYFCCKISDIQEDGTNIRINVSQVERKEVFDDYFINTRYPSSQGIEFREEPTEFVIDNIVTENQAALNQGIKDAWTAFKSIFSVTSTNDLTTEFFKRTDIFPEISGNIKGEVSYFENKRLRKYHFKDFRFDNFGVKLNINSNLVTFDINQLDEPSNKLIDDISGIITTNYPGLAPLLSNKEYAHTIGLNIGVPGVPIVMDGYVAFDFNFGGTLFMKNELTLTTHPISFSIDLSSPTRLIETSGPTSNLLKAANTNNSVGVIAQGMLSYYIGVVLKERITEEYVGVALDRTRTVNANCSYNINGQYANGQWTSNSEFFGCADYDITMSFNVVTSLVPTVDNTIVNIPQSKYVVYDLGRDTNYNDQSNNIVYTQYCWPDICKEIDLENSFFKIENVEDNNVTFHFKIKSKSDLPSAYQLFLDFANEREQLVNGNTSEFNYSDQTITFTTAISNDRLLNLIKTQSSFIKLHIKDVTQNCTVFNLKIKYQSDCSQQSTVPLTNQTSILTFDMNNEAHWQSDPNNEYQSCLGESSVYFWPIAGSFNVHGISGVDGEYNKHMYFTYEACKCLAEETESFRGYSLPDENVVSVLNEEHSDLFNNNCFHFLPNGYFLNAWIDLCYQGPTTKIAPGCLKNSKSYYCWLDSEGSDKPRVLRINSNGEVSVETISPDAQVACRLIKRN